ncbi:MAG: hypothetical protein RLZZ01_26, partial [Actinomycetota bacterium]
FAVVLLSAAGGVAAVDWWAVHGGRRRVEYVAKPFAMLLLVGVAATWGDLDAAARTWLVVGAALGVVGDVALLRDGQQAFMAGLVSFALGHLAYATAAVTIGFDPGRAAVGLVASILLVSYRFVPRAIRGAALAGGPVLAGAVVAYAAVIGAMTTTAWGTGSLLAGVGAVAFACSDWVIGHQRFIGPFPGGRLAVMIPYHGGQALLVIGLAGR